MSPLSGLGSLPLPDLQNLSSLQNLQGAKDLAGKLPGAIPTAELQGLGNALAGQAALPANTLGGNSDVARVMGAAGPTGASFGDMLGNMVREVNSKGAESADAVSGLLSGQNVSLHQAMVSMEEASVSFQLMVEVRNKLLDSYQELMRMQVRTGRPLNPSEGLPRPTSSAIAGHLEAAWPEPACDRGRDRPRAGRRSRRHRHVVRPHRLRPALRPAGGSRGGQGGRGAG
jgi:flagellar hook-basal body complex protein FliE